MREQEELRQRYKMRQRHGKQDLRFLSLLLFLGLLLYTACNLYVVTRITFGDSEILKSYIFTAFGTLLLWCLPLRLLWKFNKLGRPLYWACLCLSAYLYKDAWQVWNLSWTPEVFKYCFLVLFVLKCAMLLYGGMRLLFSSSIRSIWNVDDLFDDELAELEEVPAQVHRPVHISKSEEKARQLLKHAAIRLGACLYISVILIFVLLGILSANLPDQVDSIQAIQFQLFSECLFSVMIWSIPVFGLYMAKPWSPYLIYVAFAGEFLRAGLSYMQYVDLFTNQLMKGNVLVLFLVIEIMRYLILYGSCRSVLHHPLLVLYRKANIRKNNG